MNDLLPYVEATLSRAWDGTVKLALRETLDNRPHVARLDVLESPPGTPKTLILKRKRVKGEVAYDPDFSDGGILNTWAALEFIAEVFGSGSPAPRLYAGDSKKHFVVIEDLQDGDTLESILNGDDPERAEQALRRYGAGLGRLQAGTLGRSRAFISRRENLGPRQWLDTSEYLMWLPENLKALEALNFDVEAAAYDDAQAAARQLAQPDGFSALNHSDPQPGNIWIGHAGGFCWLDLEGAHFGHAFIEGVNSRLGFPTNAVLHMRRIPEALWRQAEEAYRAELMKGLPEAADAQIFGSAMTAACSWWVLGFCARYLALALGDDLPPHERNHLRQVVIGWIGTLAECAGEFGSLPALGETFTRIGRNLRSRWPLEARELPLYPAFQR